MVLREEVVGMPGFEPGTSCTPSRRATRLRYIPKRGRARVAFQRGWRRERPPFFAGAARPAHYPSAASVRQRTLQAPSRRPCPVARRSCRLDVPRRASAESPADPASPRRSARGRLAAPRRHDDDVLERQVVLWLTRTLFFEPPPRARERQAFAEDQLFDPEDALDVGSAIEPRTARRSRSQVRGNSFSHERSTYGCTLARSQTSGARNSARFVVSGVGSATFAVQASGAVWVRADPEV